MSKYILGAGGHCRALLSLLEKLGVVVNGIYDDNFQSEENIFCVPLLGNFADVPESGHLIIASGSPETRSRWVTKFANIDQQKYIDPTAFVDTRVELAEGVHVLGHAYINCAARIGRHVLLNTKCLVEHESEIGEFSHLAVGAIVCGRCQIGARVYIGAGAVVKDRVKICSDVMLGAGAVAVSDINEPGTYVGVPARKIK